MSKKVLVLCTTDSMIWNFLVPHIKQMIHMDYIVECACSKTGFYFDELQNQHGFVMHQIGFERSPYSLKNRKAYKQLKKLVKEKDYDVIHCHEPVGGLMGRLVGKKFKKTVLYTAHGFHFYKNAPRKNWLIYYNVEKWLSKWTDVLITINKEDYDVARRQLKAKNYEYIHGIGININKFSDVSVEKQDKLKQLCLPEDKKILLSVGELITRKNHEVIISALKDDRLKDCVYVICGTGEKLKYLQDLSRKVGVADRVHFLGFRKDVNEIYKIADIFLFTSLHEGLPVALMEAMCAGVPVVCSNSRGNEDLIDDGVGGIVVNTNLSVDYADSIVKLLERDDLCEQMIRHNFEKIKQFENGIVLNEMKRIYNKYIG